MKKFVGLMLLFTLCVCTVGCNKQVVDITYSYERAILTLPDGSVVTGAVQSWKDYEDGDQIQVVIEDKTYLVHSTDIVLISE